MAKIFKGFLVSKMRILRFFEKQQSPAFRFIVSNQQKHTVTIRKKSIFKAAVCHNNFLNLDRLIVKPCTFVILMLKFYAPISYEFGR